MTDDNMVRQRLIAMQIRRRKTSKERNRERERKKEIKKEREG